MSLSPNPKKRRVQIATHNGVFHADDVTAVAILKMLPEYQDAEIIRTRNDALIDQANVVVDVGGVYDTDSLRFDHHQSTFQETIQSLNPKKPWNVRLSSSGLVFHHFGRRLLQQLAHPTELNEKILEDMWDLVYEQFFLEIDAIDNGVNSCDCDNRLYKIHTGFSSRIGQMNPNWKQDSSPEALLKRFQDAMEVARTEFTACVQRQLDLWLPAVEMMGKVFEQRFEFDPSGQILVFPDDCPPVFVSQVYVIEKESGLEGVIKYYVFKDVMPNSYRVRSMNVKGTFDLRAPLPKAWRGLRDDELAQVSGLKEVVFIHQTGFIGGTKSKESALEMARLALKIHLQTKAEEEQEAEENKSEGECKTNGASEVVKQKELAA